MIFFVFGPKITVNEENYAQIMRSLFISAIDLV